MAPHRDALRLTLALPALFGPACVAAPTRFPLQEPLWRDGDLSPVEVACERRPDDDDPEHVACMPEPYVSPLAWDAADNTVFRPLARVLAIDPPYEAVNVNALDEAPDSSWFENRVSRRRLSRDELARGPCEREIAVDGAPGSWLIDKGKTDGATPGFRVRVPGRGKVMLKSDFGGQPERPSAASAIGVRLYYAAGFHVACDSVVYFDPALLKLKPGLTVTDNSGVTKPFDEAALKRILDNTPRRGRLLRMQASDWLHGVPLGPFKYEGTRADDPNDVVPHEDRRDLRGARLLAAWINHFDSREQNSMTTWHAVDPKVEDSSPGVVKHWYLDVSDSFGSEWAWDGISRRLGHSYYLDFAHVAGDFVTLGAIARPWARAQRGPYGETFGYFGAADFDPERWVGGYPNPAFLRMSERDGAWMARIIARFSRGDVAAIVEQGKFSRPEHTRWLEDVMIARQHKILRRYLGRLSPLADPRAEGARICLTDLAQASGAFAGASFAHRASLDGRQLFVESRGHDHCARLDTRAPEGGPPDDDASRYRVLRLSNGQAPGVVEVHAYDLGPQRGLRVVGLERLAP